jgi:hypothetical protein
MRSSGLSPDQFSGDRLDPVRRNPAQLEIPGLESEPDRMLWVKRRVKGHMAHQHRISKVLSGSAMPDSILAHHLPTISVEPFEKAHGKSGTTAGLYHPDRQHITINEDWMNSVNDDRLHDTLIHELHHHFDRTGLLGGKSPDFRRGLTSDYDPGAEGFATGAETRWAFERVRSQGGRHFPNAYARRTEEYWREPRDVRLFQKGFDRGMQGTFAEEKEEAAPVRRRGKALFEDDEKPWDWNLPREQVHEILKVARPWLSHEEREEYASSRNKVFLDPEHFPAAKPPEPPKEVPKAITERRAAKQAEIDARRKQLMEMRRRGEKPVRSPWQRY